ncbi:MAG: DUF5808 domain-containing protein [Actinomycetota bacterium]|nr:DUF5808 domain-containing protein [Actinomycetota bacterium]
MKRKSRMQTLFKLAVMALTGAALWQELQKPEGERTWNGEVAGVVPYDFRVPTFERMKAAWWNPEDERIVTPGVFGVGWTLNFGRLLRLAGPDSKG